MEECGWGGRVVRLGYYYYCKTQGAIGSRRMFVPMLGTSYAPGGEREGVPLLILAPGLRGWG